jgi:hypothetical protein
MTGKDLEDDSIQLRRGFQVWAYNPSAAGVQMKAKERPIKIECGANVLLINGETSEILGEGTAAFLRREVVDDEQFMKVYVGKLDSMFKLTKTGQHIFQIVWNQVQNNKDKDQVMLKPIMAKLLHQNISERVFQKGVRELLEKKFIFMSPIDGLYYINMSIFFNGNRIIAATEYIRSSGIKSLGQRSIVEGV